MAVPVELTWSEVVARRLDRHGLTTPAVGVTDAVRAMVGAHAQVMSAAEVSIGLRTGATVAAVKAAVADGTLVKTFGPRGTVHLLPSVDLGMWLGALSSLPTSTSLPASARLTDSQRDLVVATLAMILSELPLTADELDAEVVSATGAWAGDPVVPAFGGYWPRWRQAIATAAHAGIVAYGPNRGQKSTYVRAPRVDVPEKADLLLLHDYLYSYGPATAKDFAQWLAVPVRWTTAVFDRATLTAVVVDGREAWVNEGDVGTPDQTVSSVLLLPYFDPTSSDPSLERGCSLGWRLSERSDEVRRAFIPWSSSTALSLVCGTRSARDRG